MNRVKASVYPFVALWFLIGCGKPDDTKNEQPTVPRPNCRIIATNSNNTTAFVYTKFHNNAKGFPDTATNEYVTYVFHYNDTLITKREEFFTSTMRLRNYDSLFYYSDGKLKQIKMFMLDGQAFVNEDIFDFSYSNEHLVTLTHRTLYNGAWYPLTHDYSYEGDNIVGTKMTFADGSVRYEKYYYGTEPNPLRHLKIPIGLFLYNEGLNRPEYLGTDYPALYLSGNSIIKRDDYSGNMNIPYKIEGGYPQPYIKISSGAITLQVISTECQ